MAAMIIALVVKAAHNQRKKRKFKRDAEKQARADAFVESLLEEGDDPSNYYNNYGFNRTTTRTTTQGILPARESHVNEEQGVETLESHSPRRKSSGDMRQSSPSPKSNRNQSALTHPEGGVTGIWNDCRANEDRTAIGRPSTASTRSGNSSPQLEYSHRLEQSEEKRKKRRPFSFGGGGARIGRSVKGRSTAPVVALAPGPV